MSMTPFSAGHGRNSLFDSDSDSSSLANLDPFQNSSLLSSSFPSTGGTSSFASTQIDWTETKKAHIFKADLTGIKEEELKVEVLEGRVLRISGERTIKEEAKGETSHSVMKSSSKFNQKFTLPEGAKMDRMKSRVKDGVLTVTVPK